jgi:hypothetical protein
MAWQEIQLRQPWERMLGFTVPVGPKVIVVAYDGIYTHHLDNPQEVEEDESYPEGGEIYDECRQLLKYGGNEYSVVGLAGGKPLLTSQYGEVLMLDILRDILHIQGRDADTTFQLRYRDASGDWAVATFSDDRQYALVGVPYTLFAWQRV